MKKIIAIAALAASIQVQAAPAPAAVSPEFELEGIATVSADGQRFSINGIEFSPVAHTRYKHVALANLNGQWIEVEGQQFGQQLQAHKIELDRDHPTTPEREWGNYQVQLQGQVTADGRLWGYQANDNSLMPLANQWVEVECQINLDDNNVSDCRIDD
ncbi:DUF5666 domain-containing protein [Ferrimonas senticii]|uniref:DUF5666 domain-containing protein n=1 Tax=Ferrimonas senticii TaxID=394566 RepID=UPI00042A0CE4|nr:DUF5666 domain-containing protein [Ferrimonas senticii]